MAWTWIATVAIGWVLGNMIAFAHASWHDWTILRNVVSLEKSQWRVAIATLLGTTIVCCKRRHDADVLFQKLYMYRALINTHRHTRGLPFSVVLERGVLFGTFRNRVLGCLLEQCLNE